MFIDDEFKKDSDSKTLDKLDKSPDYNSSKRKALVAIVLFFIFCVAVVVVVMVVNGKKSNLEVKPNNTKVEVDKIETVGGLPVNYSESSRIPGESGLGDLAVEYLSFSDFYSSPNFSLDFSVQDYNLPINTKVDADNYYDVARKLDLDPGLDDLNSAGLTIIDNPFPEDDFYSLYEALGDKQLSLLLSSDFLIYYYQNVIKSTFKDIEEVVFYDNLWDISQGLYELSKNRYEIRLSQVGNVNDPLLEAERKTVAFFAVTLELLRPKEYQINTNNILNDDVNFSTQEAEKFDFALPQYLEADVLGEVELIKNHKVFEKSPVLLYARNYKDFVVPTDYERNARLANFYLASRWLNSNFPLYYASPECPSCLLDQDDWRITMMTAALISRDMSEARELQGKWARIYKVMYFFKGLRHDLNYVYYRDALKKVFGAGYDLEKLFSQDRDSIDADLHRLQTEVLNYDFVPTEGAWDKTDFPQRSKLGMKVLTESYWPNSYIAENLNYPQTGIYLGEIVDRVLNQTYCKSGKDAYRCQVSALDFVNLLQDISGWNDYFIENTYYADYQTKIDELRKAIREFPTWHNNNYWSTMDALNTVLNQSAEVMPIFAQSELWQDRNVATAAGSWINMQLPADKFSVNVDSNVNSLTNDFSKDNLSIYIEPNIYLIRHLKANTKMILDMFGALQVSQDIASVNVHLYELYEDLDYLESLVAKELGAEAWSQDDYAFVSDFMRRYSVETGKEKTLIIDSVSNRPLKYSWEGFKLLVLAHPDVDGNLKLSVGPVFDWQEGR